MYTYVHNNPVNLTDPTGHCATCIIPKDDGKASNPANVCTDCVVDTTGQYTLADLAWDVCVSAAYNGDCEGLLEFLALYTGTPEWFMAQEGFAAAKATGAFADGAKGGQGLGRIAGKEIKVTQKGLDILETHLKQFEAYGPNDAMISRLRSALAEGRTVSGADASFYLHEVSEATMMGRGMTYDAAHQAALTKFGVSPYSVYAPAVIQAFPGEFNANWSSFWTGTPY